MRGELSVLRGMLDGFRLDRDRALADLEAAQIAQAEADAAPDAACIPAARRGPEGGGRWAWLRAVWRGE